MKKIPNNHWKPSKLGSFAMACCSAAQGGKTGQTTLPS